MHHPFVIYFAFATRIFINTFASARSQRRSDLDQAEVESNVEGKPHLKRSGENTVRKERLPRSIRNGDNFSSFFSTGCAFRVLPPLMNMATRGGNMQPARLVYTSFGRFSHSVLCLWFCRYHASDTWLHNCVVPVSSGCTTAFLHMILLYYRGLAEMVLSYHLNCFYESRISCYLKRAISSRSALSNNFLIVLPLFARY